MPLTVSMTEAKRDFYELYDRAAAGEEILITRWGRPVARMIHNPDYRPSAGDMTDTDARDDPRSIRKE